MKPYSGTTNPGHKQIIGSHQPIRCWACEGTGRMPGRDVASIRTRTFEPCWQCHGAGTFPNKDEPKDKPIKWTVTSGPKPWKTVWTNRNQIKYCDVCRFARDSRYHHEHHEAYLRTLLAYSTGKPNSLNPGRNPVRHGPGWWEFKDETDPDRPEMQTGQSILAKAGRQPEAIGITTANSLENHIRRETSYHEARKLIRFLIGLAKNNEIISVIPVGNTKTGKTTYHITCKGKTTGQVKVIGYVIQTGPAKDQGPRLVGQGLEAGDSFAPRPNLSSPGLASRPRPVIAPGWKALVSWSLGWLGILMASVIAMSGTELVTRSYQLTNTGLIAALLLLGSVISIVLTFRHVPPGD